MSTLTVFDCPEQARSEQENLDKFRVSGFSVIKYVIHHIEPAQVVQARKAGSIRPVVGPTTYESKLRTGNAIVYCNKMELKPEVAHSLLDHRTRRVSSINHHLIWIKGSPVLISAVPLKFQVDDLRDENGRPLVFSPTFHIQEPLGIAALIDLLNVTESSAFSEALTSATSDSLGGIGIDVKAPSVFLDACSGVDVWSLTGTLDRPAALAFVGREECAKYSWSIAAILNYTSDHLVNHFFDLVSHEEVFNRVRRGFGFMQDHGIFMSAACVLEITHFGYWVPQRSWDRLEYYGYDSSTMFLLGIAVARAQTLKAIAEVAARRIDVLSRDVLASEEERAHRDALGWADLLDDCQGIQLDLRESRSVLVDSRLQEHLGDQQLRRAARQRVQDLRVLALERLRRRQEGHEQLEMARLAFAAAVLAVAAIPGAVEVLWGWWTTGAWGKASVALAIMMSALLFAIVALRRRSRRRRFST